MPSLITLLELASTLVGALGGVVALILGVRQARRIRRTGEDSVATRVLSGDYVVPVHQNKRAA